MTTTTPHAPVIPAACADAVGMAFRVAVIADRLAGLDVKPSNLSIGYAFLWGLEHKPRAVDAVSIQTHSAADFLTVEAAFGLSRQRWQRDEETGAIAGNVNASGIVDGVAVALFDGARPVADAEGVPTGPGPVNDDLWQVDELAPGEAGSNVAPVTDIYHQCGPDSINLHTVREHSRHVRVVCSCGAVYEAGERS